VLVAVGLMVGMSPAAHADSPTSDSPRIVDLGTLDGTNSFATAQNEQGQVVGASDTATGEQHAFSWTKRGGMVDLGTLGGDNSSATTVNAVGRVANPVRSQSGTRT
jgi:probable HAF family extracellular repeat protein